MAKTEFLQIRISPTDRDRLQRIADSEHLDISTWARQTLLRAADRWDAQVPVPQRKVAEPTPDRIDKRRKRD